MSAAVGRVREALIERSGVASMADLEAATGMDLAELSRALGALFETEPGHIETTEEGGFAVVLDAPNQDPVAAPAAALTVGRAALVVAFGGYSFFYAGIGIVAAAIASGQSSVLRWFYRMLRGSPADPATGAPSVPSLRERIEGFFLGPAALLPGRWAADRTALAAARLRGNTLTVVDLMAVFGHERSAAEAELARLVFQHGGQLEQLGQLPHVYFPGLPPLSPSEVASVQAEVGRGAADETARRAAASAQDRVAMGLGATNVFFGLLVVVGAFNWVGIGTAGRVILGWLPLLLSIGLFVFAFSQGGLRLRSSQELKRRGQRAELVREMLMQEGVVTRPARRVEATERALLDELAVELGGVVTREGEDLVARFEGAHAWAMAPLDRG